MTQENTQETTAPAAPKKVKKRRIETILFEQFDRHGVNNIVPMKNQPPAAPELFASVLEAVRAEVPGTNLLMPEHTDYHMKWYASRYRSARRKEAAAAALALAEEQAELPLEIVPPTAPGVKIVSEPESEESDDDDDDDEESDDDDDDDEEFDSYFDGDVDDDDDDFDPDAE